MQLGASVSHLIVSCVVVAACRGGAPPPSSAPRVPRTADPASGPAPTPVPAIAPAAPTAVAPVIVAPITLADGRAATARYDFDADALRAVVAVADGLVVATASGNLVHATSALAVDAVALAAPPVVALTSDGRGGAVAALGDGSVATVAPSLQLAPLGAVAGTPRWIGRWRDQLVVVADDARATLAYRLDARTGAAIGQPLAGVSGTTFAIDAAGRLWWGRDAGEWGGSVGAVDLASGAITPDAHMRDGVMGLLVHAGDALAYGGTTHMGYTNGMIASLVRHATVPAPPAVPPEDGAPARRLPITRMIAQGDHLLVFVWNIAYAVDPSLTAWTRLAALPARVRWGRPDAVGAYPAIVDAVVLPDGAAVIATVRDGLFRIDRSGAVTAHAVAGPIAFAPSRAYVSDGAAVIDDDGALWRRVADRWEALTMPATITRATEVTFVPQAHGAGLVAVDTRDGLRMLAWGAGAATVADAGPAEASYPQVVGIGDEVWRVGAGTLWRWQPDGTWQVAGHYVERDDDHPRRGDVAMPGRLAGAQVGTHRLIVDGWHRRLLRLTVGGRGGATLADVGAAERVIALDAERALVIAGGVAQIYVAATGRLTPYPVALPPVIAAALDAGGRLWVATARGLVLVEDDVARPVPVPALTGRPIVDLIADPDGGVTATLGAGGLVRVTFD